MSEDRGLTSSPAAAAEDDGKYALIHRPTYVYCGLQLYFQQGSAHEHEGATGGKLHTGRLTMLEHDWCAIPIS